MENTEIVSTLDLAAPVSENHPENTTQNTNQQYFKFVGFLPRFIATIVDGIIILIAALLLTFAIQTLTGEPFSLKEDSPFELLVGVIGIFYSITMLTVQGATIGKKLFHIRVVNKEYNQVTLFQAIIRETIGKILSGLLNLGYIWVLIDDKRQSWHDKIAKTYVIYDQPVTREEFETLQKHSNLPLVLIVTGIIESILPISLMVFIIPQLTKFYQNLDATGFNPVVGYSLVGLVIALALTQIVFGIICMKKQKRGEYLDVRHKDIAKILVIAGAVAIAIIIPVMILSILVPLYSALNSIQ